MQSFRAEYEGDDNRLRLKRRMLLSENEQLRGNQKVTGRKEEGHKRHRPEPKRSNSEARSPRCCRPLLVYHNNFAFCLQLFGFGFAVRFQSLVGWLVILKQ